MRVILAFVDMKPSRKLKILILCQIFFAIVTLIIVEGFGYLKFGAYFSSLTIGASVSALFGLFFVLPS
jgi:hypothetical protein